jgi:hypothetical protein
MIISTDSQREQELAGERYATANGAICMFQTQSTQIQIFVHQSMQVRFWRNPYINFIYFSSVLNITFIYYKTKGSHYKITFIRFIKYAVKLELYNN